MLNKLTESSLGDYCIAGFRRLGLSSSIDSNHPEFVFLTFGKIRSCGFGLSGWYVDGVDPVRTALLFLLYDVAGDRGAAVVGGLGPRQIDVILVPIDDAWSARSIGFVYVKKKPLKSQVKYFSTKKKKLNPEKKDFQGKKLPNSFLAMMLLVVSSGSDSPTLLTALTRK